MIRIDYQGHFFVANLISNMNFELVVFYYSNELVKLNRKDNSVKCDHVVQMLISKRENFQYSGCDRMLLAW